MKVVILKRDMVIDGRIYREGEVVQVPDDFKRGIRRVVSTSEDEETKRERRKRRIADAEKDDE